MKIFKVSIDNKLVGNFTSLIDAVDYVEKTHQVTGVLYKRADGSMIVRIDNLHTYTIEETVNSDTFDVVRETPYDAPSEDIDWTLRLAKIESRREWWLVGVFNDRYKTNVEYDKLKTRYGREYNFHLSRRGPLFAIHAFRL